MTTEELKRLEQEYSNAAGIDRIDLLHDLSKGYLHSNPLKTVRYAEIALDLSSDLQNEEKIALSYKYLGSGNNLLNNYNRSLDYFKQSLAIQAELNDKSGSSASLNNIAVTYSLLGNNEKALTYYLQALDIFEEINHTKGIAACISNIGILYKKFGELDKAKSYYEKSLKVAEDNLNEYGIAAALNNIGEIYNMSGDYSLALDFFNRSKTVAEKIDSFELQISVNNNLGVIHMVLEDYSTAITVLLDSFRLSNEVSKTDGMISSLINISKCYMYLGNYSTALSNMTEAVKLAETLKGSPDIMLEIHSSFTDIYYHKGDYQNAFYSLKKYQDKKSEIMNESARMNIAELHTKYESDKKEKEAELFRLKNVELKSINAELQRLNATKNKFFSIIAHDLRNPFHALLGMLSYFSTHISELELYEISEIASQLKQSSEQVNKLLENLLDWAKIQTDDIIAIPTHFDIAGIVDENVQLLNTMANSKQITLSNLVKNGITVLADQRMINSVIQNCITNSIKFTSREGQITIISKQLKKLIEIEIRDNGVGIDDVKIRKLFKEEEQIHTRGTEDEKGTGLGLLLSKEFIEKNNGSIWVVSKKDEGTSLFITIPLAD